MWSVEKFELSARTNIDERAMLAHAACSLLTVYALWRAMTCNLLFFLQIRLKQFKKIGRFLYSVHTFTKKAPTPAPHPYKKQTTSLFSNSSDILSLRAQIKPPYVTNYQVPTRCWNYFLSSKYVHSRPLHLLPLFPGLSQTVWLNDTVNVMVSSGDERRVQGPGARGN